MPDMSGRKVLTANLTFDETTGIGKWSEDDFVRALRFGVRPRPFGAHLPDGPLS
jgi:hypothetical protein